MSFSSVIIEAKGGHLDLEELAILDSAIHNALSEKAKRSVSRFEYLDRYKGFILNLGSGSYNTFSGMIFDAEMNNKKGESCRLQILIPSGAEEVRRSDIPIKTVTGYLTGEDGSFRVKEKVRTSIDQRDVKVGRRPLN